MDTLVAKAPEKTKSAPSRAGHAGIKPTTRVGLAFQGGSFLAGAVSTGVVEAFAEEGIFQDYDLRIFSGTSAGALVATACWSHAMRAVLERIPLEAAMMPLPGLLKKIWLHWTQVPVVPNETVGDFFKFLDASWRHMPPWEGFVQNVRAPLLRILFRQWIREYLTRDWLKPCVQVVHDHYRTIKQRIPDDGQDPEAITKSDGSSMEQRVRDAFSIDRALPRLVLGSANVLKGEIMGFSEYDVAVAADDAYRKALDSGMSKADATGKACDAGVDRLYDFIEASGSLEELNGSTTIHDGRYAGTYYDGAWGQNPPIDDLLDYTVNELWRVEIFPKERPTLPDTFGEREDRKEELLQNALVEHEMHIINKVNEWILNGRFITDYDEYKAYLDWKAKRGETIAKPIVDENEFKPYHEIKTRRLPMTLDFTPGARIVNWAPFLLDKMRYGHDNARQFGSVLQGG